MTVTGDVNAPGLAATTVNLSESGVCLSSDQANSLSPVDEVTCEIALPPGDDRALPAWGLGRVVRVEGDKKAAVQLFAGIYGPEESESD